MNIDKIYSEILENLRLRIVSEYGSIAKFCDKNDVSKYNLSRVFCGRHLLSVSLYVRINESLGVLRRGSNIPFDSSLTLKEYLCIDHASVIQSMFNNIIG